jgi:hypothetical protein
MSTPHSKAPRAASPCQVTTAKIRVAQGEMQLLGLAAMNGWFCTPSSNRFSLQALRDSLRDRDDAHAPPDFKRCWYLRSMDRRAAAIFLEVELAFEAVAAELGLVVHVCPNAPQFAVLVRAGVIVHWPESAGEVRRTRRVRN